jgi:hypothetical protein
MKNKIEIGSRWRSVGRNLPSYEGVVKMVTHKNDFIYLLRDGDDMSAPYDKYFFLANFEPIKDETVRGFKVGDICLAKIKCRIEKVGTNEYNNKIGLKIPDNNNLIGLFTEEIADFELLEPAKIDLAVGQVWSDDNKAYYVLDIYRGRVIFRWTIAGSHKWGIDEMRDSEFKDQYAHKLISEAGDE